MVQVQPRKMRASPSRGTPEGEHEDDCGGIPTKHYLQAEITTTARRFHFSDLGIEKIEYPWNTEFHNPPRWMRAPFPWDWLALLKKS